MNIKKEYKKKNQSGFSIIELLTATAISIIVLSGISRVVAVMSANAKAHQSQADIHETLSFASNRISYALKHSFSSACGDITTMARNEHLYIAAANDTNTTYSVGEGVPIVGKKGIDITGSKGDLLNPYDGYKLKVNDFPLFKVGVIGDAFSTSALANSEPNTDYFVVIDSGEKLAISNSKKDSEAGVLSVSKDVQIGASSIFMISDCSQATIFKVVESNVLTDTLTLAGDLSFPEAYGAGNSLLTKINFFVYYVGRDGENRVGLRRYDLMSGQDIQVSDGVSSMKLTLGLGTSLSTQAYFTAEEISTSSASLGYVSDRVLSVKVDYLAESVDNNVGNQVSMSHITALRNKIERD